MSKQTLIHETMIIKPRISIITVCFNDKQGFIQTAESVLRQSCKEFEWIVIDGGSTDGSRLEIEKIDNHIDYWVSEPDKGIYNGMNKGIAVASGEYCLFLNSGDFLCSKKSIERVKDRLDGTDIIVFDIFSEKKLPFGLKPYHIMPSAITLGSLVNSGICHQAAFIKTTLLKENNYDESLRITSDWKFFFEELIVRESSYKHVGIPFASFDCTGISSKNDERNNSEKQSVLESYFDNSLINQVKFIAKWDIALAKTAGYPLLTEIVRGLIFVDKKIFRNFIAVYKNLRYVD